MTIYKDQLEAVYRLIEKPENWTQGAYARDANGELIATEYGDRYPDNEDAPTHPDAACWCLYGAGMKYRIDVDELERICGNFNLATFNDNHSHAEVLALLRSAIERAPVRP